MIPELLFDFKDGSLIDLIGGVELTENSTPTLTDDQHGHANCAYDYSGSTKKAHYNASVPASYEESTIILVFDPPSSSAGYATIYGSDSVLIYTDTTAGNLVCVLWDDRNGGGDMHKQISSGSFQSGYNVLILTYDSSHNIEMWLNGTLRTSVVNSTTNVSCDYGGLCIGDRLDTGSVSTNSDHDYLGLVSYVAVFDGVMPDDLIKAWSGILMNNHLGGTVMPGWYGVKHYEITDAPSTENMKCDITINWKVGMAHDFRDVRFTTLGLDRIEYHLKQYTYCDSAKFAIKLPEADMTDILVFYNNPDAVYDGRISEVYTLGDDFPNGILSAELWTQSGTVSGIPGGGLKMGSASTTNDGILSADSFAVGSYSVEMMVASSTYSAINRWGFWDATETDVATFYTYGNSVSGHGTSTRNNATTTWWNAGSTYGADYHLWKVTPESSSSVKYYVDDVLVKTETTNCPNHAMNVELVGYTANAYLYVLWVGVFETLDTEPTFTEVSDEKLSAPVWINGYTPPPIESWADDDFETGSINSTLWEVYNGVGSCGIMTSYVYDGTYSAGITQLSGQGLGVGTYDQNHIFVKIPLTEFAVSDTYKWSMYMYRNKGTYYWGHFVGFGIGGTDEVYEPVPYNMLGTWYLIEIYITRTATDGWSFAFYRNGEYKTTVAKTKTMTTYFKGGMQTRHNDASDNSFYYRMDNVVITKQ